MKGSLGVSREPTIGDVEQLGWIGRRRKRIGVSDSGDVVLLDHALPAAAAATSGL